VHLLVKEQLIAIDSFVDITAGALKQTVTAI